MGLFQRLDGQFALEEIPIGAVLAQGLSPLTGLPIEAHEKAVDVLLKGIEDEETLTGGYGLAPLPPGNKALDETGQSAEEKQKEPFPFKGEPLLEFGGVRNGEPGQQVPPVEIKGSADAADTLRSGGETGLRVLEARLENLLEIARVHPARGIGWNGDPGAFDGQTGLGRKANLVESAAQFPQCAAEVITSLGLRGLTPQESGQVLAGEPLPGLAGQVDEESLLFPGQKLGQGNLAIEEP